MPLLDKERKLIPNCTAANLFQKSERALLAFKAGKPIIKERNKFQHTLGPGEMTRNLPQEMML